MEPKIKNITRFDTNIQNFNGYRFCICRNGKTFTKYFSDKKLGGKEKSFEAAKEARVKVMEVLSETSKPPTDEMLDRIGKILGVYPTSVY